MSEKLMKFFIIDKTDNHIKNISLTNEVLILYFCIVKMNKVE